MLEVPKKMMRCRHCPLFWFRSPIVTTSRFWLLGLSLLAVLTPAVADAQCVLNGTSVTCTGSDPDGFDAGVDDDLTVDVLPDASVDNGGAAGVNTLQLNNGNTVDVQAGTGGQADAVVTASGAGSHAIAAADNNTITNAGSISVTGDGGSGISVGDNNTATNDGSITVSGAGGTGMAGQGYAQFINNGTIALSGGGNTGASAQDNATLYNRGTISAADANSVGLAAGSNAGDVRNELGAQIILDGDDSIGIQVGDDNGLAYNQGTITASGDRSTGIQVGNGNPGASNPGTISISGADGIGMDGGDGNAVYSSQTLEVTGASGIGIRFGDDNDVNTFGTVTANGSDGIGILLGTAAGTQNILTNDGTITGGDGSGVGVSFAPSGSGTTNTLRNRAGGVIDGSASGVAILGSAGAEDVTNRGTITGDVRLEDGDDNLDNYGTITGSSVGGAAVSFAPSGSGTTNTLMNLTNGVIDGSASGVAILGSAGVETITNYGTIIRDVQLGGGDDVFILWPVGVLTGAIDAGGDSDTLQLESVAAGALNLSNLSNFEVLDLVGSGTWTLSGSGSFPNGTTVSNGTLALDQTVNLSGDYTQGAGTSLHVRLNPDGTSDQLVIDGNATIEPGTIDAGTILQLEPTGLLINDATYTILTTTGTLTGLFDELSLPGDTGALSFTQVATASSLAIDLLRSPYASAAATGNQRATGIHLDEILAAQPPGPPPDPPTDMETVLISLDTLSGSELRAALDTLHPEVYDAQANAMLSFGRSAAELAAFRRPRCEEVVYERRPEIVAPSPCSRSWMPWGSAFGLFAKRDGNGDHIDYDHGGGGLLLGADHPLGEHFLVYGFFGGGYTSVDVDAVGEGHLISATLGAGGRWSLGGTRIHGLVGYARGWHEQEREIDFGQDIYRISRTAKADYASNLIMALVKAGHTFRFGSLDLEPLATAEYGYLMEESFEESGAGDLDLEVDKRSNSVLSTTVGARLAYTYFKWEYIEDWLEWADGVWTPEVTARWRGNWIGRERDLDARMVGAPAGVSGFTVEGQDAKQGLQVGAGVAFRPLRLLTSIRVDYDGFYGDGSMIHRIGVSIRVPLGGSAS